MKLGEAHDGIRRALNILDEWNDVAGVVEKGTGYYYELQGVIEDAVHCGIQCVYGPLPSESDTPPLAEDVLPTPVEFHIYPVIYCDCGHAMYYQPPAPGPKTVECRNHDCERFRIAYHAPTVALHPVKEE